MTRQIGRLLLLVSLTAGPSLEVVAGDGNLRPGFDPRELDSPAPARPAPTAATMPAPWPAPAGSPGADRLLPPGGERWTDLPNPYREGPRQDPAVERASGTMAPTFEEYGPPPGGDSAPNANLLPAEDGEEMILGEEVGPFNSSNLRPSGNSPHSNGGMDSEPVVEPVWSPSKWNSFGQRPNFATLPEVFGGATYLSSRAVLNNQVAFDVSPGGVSQRVSIAQHNKAMTENRFYLVSQTLANAVSTNGPGGPRSGNVERYLFGVERSFAEGALSVELRAPFHNDYDFSAPGLLVAGGSIGNLTAIVKGIMFDDSSLSVSSGIGVSTPTGDRVTGFTPGGSQFVLEDDAVHLLPFIAFSGGGDSNWFASGFLQGDFATGGNAVRFNALTARYDEQNLLQADLSLGAWLVRDASSHLRDLAVITEFQYIAVLQDSDVVMLADGGGNLLLSNSLGRSDLANFTVGLHGNLASGISLRAGWTVPLNESDRFYDGQITAAISLQR